MKVFRNRLVLTRELRRREMPSRNSMPRCVVLLIITTKVLLLHFWRELSIRCLFESKWVWNEDWQDEWSLLIMASKKFSKHFVQTRASLWDVISFFSFIDDSFIVVFCQFDTDSTTQSFVYIFLFLLCRFWLSLICCVLSVVCITAVNTVIQYMPLVFLMEAEKTQGDVCFIFHFY